MSSRQSITISKTLGGGLKCLQGLRCYSVLAVFFSHCPDFRLSWLGALGVSFFILMSGYLAAYKYYDSGVSSQKWLVLKRLRTYYPIHIFTLICNIILSFRASWTADRFIILILNALLLQSYVPVYRVYFSFNAVSWYLSLTMFFTLITPAALKILHTIERRSIILKSTVTLCTFQFIWYFFIVKMPAANHWLAYVSPFIRSVDFMLGGLVFLLFRHDKINNRTNYIFLPALILEFALLILSRKHDSEFFSACAWTIPNMIIMICALLNENTNSIIKVIS